MWTEMENCKMGTKGTEPWHLCVARTLWALLASHLYFVDKKQCAQRGSQCTQRKSTFEPEPYFPDSSPADFILCATPQLSVWTADLECLGELCYNVSFWVWTLWAWSFIWIVSIPLAVVAGLGGAAWKEVLMAPGGSRRLAPGLRVLLKSKLLRSTHGNGQFLLSLFPPPLLLTW